MDIYTIGHSTRSMTDFISMLKRYDIEVLVDIRSDPGSRYVPHFNKEQMEVWLPIQYMHLPELGGHKKPLAHISNTFVDGWRLDAFRNYAKYTLVNRYELGIEKLLSVASTAKICYMCSEAKYWGCHRLLVSNTLASRGINVLHIMDKLVPHELNKYGAKSLLTDGLLIYPASIQ